MAAQTMSAILDRFKTVLEAPPLNLVASTNPFDDADVPATLVDMTYRLVSAGLVSDVPTSNYQSLRIERVTVTMAKTIGFQGYTAQQTLHNTLDAIERAVIADGPDHGYLVSIEKGSRKVTRPKNTDLLQASISFLVDYDYSES